MENKEIMLSNHELAASATAAQAKAEIECAYVMAVRRPRNIEDVRTKILGSCQRPVFAESVEWTKPMGKDKKITGPSIRFVEIALQALGNVRTNATVIYEDENIRKIHVSVTDLESNSAFSKDCVLEKTVERSYLKKDQTAVSKRVNSKGEITYLVAATEDDMANKQASQESKIIRNCGLRLIPQDIVEEAMEVAKKTRQKNAGDPQAAKKKIIDAFSGLGIMPSDLEKYSGKKIEQLLPDDIDDLRKIFTAIKAGESKWSDYLQDASVDPDTDESVAAKLARAKAKKTAPKEPETVVDPPVPEKPETPKTANLTLTDAQRTLNGLPEHVFTEAMRQCGYKAVDLNTLSDSAVSRVLKVASELPQ